MDRTKRTDTLRRQQIAADVRLVEQNILGRIIDRIRFEKTIIIIQFLRFLLMKSDNDFILSAIADSIDHM